MPGELISSGILLSASYSSAARRDAACRKRISPRGSGEIDGQARKGSGRARGSERVNRTSPEQSPAIWKQVAGFSFWRRLLEQRTRRAGKPSDRWSNPRG